MAAKAKKGPSKAQLKKLSKFAEGQPVDELAADRYRQALPDVGAVLRLCVSSDPAQVKTGRLRAAAVCAAMGDDT